MEERLPEGKQSYSSLSHQIPITLKIAISVAIYFSKNPLDSFEN